MGKIGDLWVRLGLKSEEYKKGMDSAKKETKTFSQGLGKLKAGAVAVWAAIGAAVMTFAKDFIAATNIVGDAWQRTMDGIRASYQSVLADVANYKPDFSSFKNFFKNEWDWIKRTFGNADEAGAAAREMSRAFDAEFELVNSIRLQKAMIQEELNELYIAMRDTTLSPADRKAAAEKYRTLLQPLADAEVAVYSDMLDKAVVAWQAGNDGMLSRLYSTDEVRDFFANIGVNPAAMQEKYGELFAYYDRRKGDKQNQVIYDTLLKLEQAAAQMSDVSKVLSRSELSINKALSEFDIKLAEDLADGLAEVEANVDGLEDVLDIDITMPEIDLSALDKADEQIKEFLAEWQKEQAELAQLNGMLGDAIVNSLGGSIEAFTDMIFGLEGADPSNILAALLQPFADTATQLGGMLLAQGLAIKAFKESLTNLDEGVAIAAGVALLAMGAAMRSGIKSLAGGGAGGGSASSYGGNSYGSPDSFRYDNTMTIYVEGKVSGSDILLAGSNQQNQWDR